MCNALQYSLCKEKHFFFKRKKVHLLTISPFRMYFSLQKRDLLSSILSSRYQKDESDCLCLLLGVKSKKESTAVFYSALFPCSLVLKTT